MTLHPQLTLMFVYLCLYTGTNDGTVALEETKLGPGFQTDRVQLHLPHTTIASSAEIAPLVVDFLLNGAFKQLGNAQHF